MGVSELEERPLGSVTRTSTLGLARLAPGVRACACRSQACRAEQGRRREKQARLCRGTELTPYREEGQSSVPANCCHVELCEQSCQIFLFSRESENISCKIFQFSNMATSFPFESLTQHAGRLTCPIGYQAECLRRPREVLLKDCQFTLHSAPCG